VLQHGRCREGRRADRAARGRPLCRRRGHATAQRDDRSGGRWYGGSYTTAGAGATYVDSRTVSYNIYDASDPKKVVAAIKKYEQSNGANWRK
jgi:hypothetical protein